MEKISMLFGILKKSTDNGIKKSIELELSMLRSKNKLLINNFNVIADEFTKYPYDYPNLSDDQIKLIVNVPRAFGYSSKCIAENAHVKQVLEKIIKEYCEIDNLIGSLN